MTDVYTSQVRGLISQIASSEGSLIFLNLDSAATHGVEGEVEGKWRTGISSRISYSYQNARNLTTGKLFVNSARQLATVNVAMPVIGRQVFAGLDLHYVGRVETLNGTFTDSFVVPNLTLTSRDFHNRLSLSASLYNVLNSMYGYPGGGEHRQNIIYQDGRTFRVGLKYTWQMEKHRAKEIEK
jgi:iron complex outermembrane receptor protein